MRWLIYCFLFCSKLLIQPYLQFWRLILKINVYTVSANATVCTWKVMTCMASNGTWYCLLSGRTYGTNRECSLSQKFHSCQKLDSLGFQLQKWRILTSKAINGEVSHYTDNCGDIFSRAVIEQNISRGTKLIVDNIYNLFNLIAVTWFHIGVRNKQSPIFGSNYYSSRSVRKLCKPFNLLLFHLQFHILLLHMRGNPIKGNFSLPAREIHARGSITSVSSVHLAISVKIEPTDNQSDSRI